MENEVKTPWNPCKTAEARVTNPLPAPTVCPHCCSAVEIVGNEEIYGKPYGKYPWAYRCKSYTCDSYVGMHPFTNIPLGTLANRTLREARKRVKEQFNPIWQGRLTSRRNCYEALARAMNMPPSQCHFGWFNLEQCERAEKILLKGLRFR
ncbi:zinc-finger-containing protein [Comamonas thiooxydans]|uniref:zinc-finger-containing protein n=1 Tax=Comamonas thiooxydans TaxID=363952 RepID=UPI000B42356C|nr:zinc-finger-containing protein [Comamonas thiooxydans]